MRLPQDLLDDVWRVLDDNAIEHVDSYLSESSSGKIKNLWEMPNDYATKVIANPAMFNVQVARWHSCKLAEIKEREQREREIELKKANAAQRWENICPPNYQNIDYGLLPFPDKSRRVIDGWHNDWFPDKDGLLLLGPTGSGKTRTMFALLRRLMAHYWNAEFEYIRFSDWCLEASRRAKDCELSSWMDELTRGGEVRYVVIDDFAKTAALTPTVQSQAYRLLEECTSNDISMIITTTFDKQQLLGRFEEHIGPDIVRRIVDYCETVRFQ